MRHNKLMRSISIILLMRSISIILVFVSMLMLTAQAIDVSTDLNWCKNMAMTYHK